MCEQAIFVVWSKAVGLKECEDQMLFQAGIDLVHLTLKINKQCFGSKQLKMRLAFGTLEKSKKDHHVAEVLSS